MQSYGLYCALNNPKYKCTAETCEWHNAHPKNFQDDKNKGHDFAKIPDQLAEYVAQNVTEILTRAGVHRKPHISITDDMKKKFIEAVEVISHDGNGRGRSSNSD